MLLRREIVEQPLISLNPFWISCSTRIIDSKKHGELCIVRTDRNNHAGNTSYLSTKRRVPQRTKEHAVRQWCWLSDCWEAQGTTSSPLPLSPGRSVHAQSAAWSYCSGADTLTDCPSGRRSEWYHGAAHIRQTQWLCPAIGCLTWRVVEFLDWVSMRKFHGPCWRPWSVLLLETMLMFQILLLSADMVKAAPLEVVLMTAGAYLNVCRLPDMKNIEGFYNNLPATTRKNKEIVQRGSCWKVLQNGDKDVKV